MTTLFALLGHLLYALLGAFVALAARRYLPAATTFFTRIGL